jgi:NAD(P)-dependent dehydrogenase (short-subunit alcohol dehydrogenase family)
VTSFAALHDMTGKVAVVTGGSRGIGRSEELFDKTLAVNLKGPFRLAALAATHMAAHDGGSIVNIGTTASLTASVGELPYACAKAGLNALTVGLAEAYAPKVRVNGILPGPFRTDISKGWAPPEGAEVPFVPLGRMGDPAELGAAGAAPGQCGVELHDRGDHPRGRRHHPQGVTASS